MSLPRKPRSLLRQGQTASCSPVAYWQQRLRDLPDLRWAKVDRARRALESGAYDAEEASDAVLASLANEIGVLCRRLHVGRVA